jgi:hypothetical protein
MTNETNRPAEPAGSGAVEGAAEKQAQSDLTNKVGERLTRQESPSNKKLSTWKSRLGFGKSE